MTARINIQVTGLESLAKKLTTMKLNMRNLGPATRKMSLELRRVVNASFRTEVAPSGVPWAPLRPATIAARQRRGLVPIRKLQATGRLKRSIHITVKRGVQLTADAPYAGYLQHGTSKMAARPFVPFTRSGQFDQGGKGKALVQRMARILLEHLTRV